MFYSNYFCFFTYAQFPIIDIKISVNSMIFTKFLDFRPLDF